MKNSLSDDFWKVSATTSRNSSIQYSICHIIESIIKGSPYLYQIKEPEPNTYSIKFFCRSNIKPIKGADHLEITLSHFKDTAITMSWRDNPHKVCCLVRDSETLTNGLRTIMHSRLPEIGENDV